MYGFFPTCTINLNQYRIHEASGNITLGLIKMLEQSDPNILSYFPKWWLKKVNPMVQGKTHRKQI